MQWNLTQEFHACIPRKFFKNFVILLCSGNIQVCLICKYHTYDITRVLTGVSDKYIFNLPPRLSPPMIVPPARCEHEKRKPENEVGIFWGV